MLVQRRRRWNNIKPALMQRIVFVGLVVHAGDGKTTVYEKRGVVGEKSLVTKLVTLDWHYLTLVTRRWTYSTPTKAA